MIENMGPQISIVVPTLNSPTITTTLLALARQNASESVLEILVVGQQDLQSFDYGPKVRLIEVDGIPTPAANRNIGAREARGEWLCFTDSDCIPCPDWIAILSQAMISGHMAAAGPVDVPQSTSYWGMCDHLVAFTSQIIPTTTMHAAATLNFCVHRDLFLELGGFDESFKRAAGEDRELCWRVRQAGYDIVFVPGAIVQHNHPRQDFVSAWRHLYQYGEATIQFRHKHMDSYSWRFLEPLLKLPAMGELAALSRAFVRAMGRPFLKPSFLKYARFWPGLLLLDVAHSLGIVSAVRSDET